MKSIVQQTQPRTKSPRNSLLFIVILGFLLTSIHLFDYGGHKNPVTSSDGIEAESSCAPSALYPSSVLARSVIHTGSNIRLMNLLKDFESQHNKMRKYKLAVVGGSVSAGHGLKGSGKVFWQRVFKYLAGHYNAKNIEWEFIDGSVPAMGSFYFTPCIGEHIPKDVDLILIELAINDGRSEPITTIAFENLLRYILESNPAAAIIVVQTFSLHFSRISMGGDMHIAPATYYDIPVLSIRPILLPLMLKNVSLQQEFFALEADGSQDLRHINQLGHKILSDVIIEFFKNTECNMDKKEISTLDSLFYRNIHEYSNIMQQPLMSKYDQNFVYEKQAPFCHSVYSKSNPLKPVRSEGWELEQIRDKTYLTAKEPGSTVTFEFTNGPAGSIAVLYKVSEKTEVGKVRCQIDQDQISFTLDGFSKYATQSSVIAGPVPEIALAPGTHQITCTLLQNDSPEKSDMENYNKFQISAVVGN